MKNDINSSEMNDKWSEPYTSSDILAFILRWRKAILIVLFVSIVVSVLLSSSIFIKPRFRSFASLYPTNLSSYSEETATEQMLQIFQSDFIRDSIIEKFNLGEHYGLKENQDYYKALLFDLYYERVSFEKTEYESVELTVEDIDPKLACDMVNTIINLFSEKARRMHRVNEWEVVQSLQSQMNFKKKELDTMELRLTKMREDYGLLDYDTQTKYATKEYLKSIADNSSNKTLKPLIENLEKEGSKFVLLSNQFDQSLSDYNRLKKEYENALKQYNRDLNYVSIVKKPYVSDRKSYPVRWIIVLVSVIASQVILFVFASFMDSMKKMKNA